MPNLLAVCWLLPQVRSLCDRKDWSVAVTGLRGPRSNFQMRKEVSSPVSKSFTQQDKSPSRVLGFYDPVAYDPQPSRDGIHPVSIYNLGTSYLLLLKLYFFDCW